MSTNAAPTFRGNATIKIAGWTTPLCYRLTVEAADKAAAAEAMYEQAKAFAAEDGYEVTGVKVDRIQAIKARR